jgi:hypothetical protein
MAQFGADRRLEAPMHWEENTIDTRKQLSVLGALVAVYALLAAATYLFIPLQQLVPTQVVPVSELAIPRWQLALANAGIGVGLYSLLGRVGYRFARRLGLPAVFRPGAGGRRWLLHPLLLGMGLGLVIGLADFLCRRSVQPLAGCCSAETVARLSFFR